MNAWFLFECIYDVCLNDFFFLWENVFMKFWTFSFWKCIYECMIFFLNACMSEWFYFILWENAFMKFWAFSFWKCIYECMIFFECIYSVCWMILFYFMRKCIYEILDFFFLKIPLWMDDFFWIYFCFLFICTHAYFFFENAYINGIFGNAYTMYEILEKCIGDFVNAYVDIHKLILFL